MCPTWIPSSPLHTAGLPGPLGEPSSGLNPCANCGKACREKDQGRADGRYSSRCCGRVDFLFESVVEGVFQYNATVLAAPLPPGRTEKTADLLSPAREARNDRRMA